MPKKSNYTIIPNEILPWFIPVAHINVGLSLGVILIYFIEPTKPVKGYCTEAFRSIQVPFFRFYGNKIFQNSTTEDVLGSTQSPQYNRAVKELMQDSASWREAGRLVLLSHWYHSHLVHYSLGEIPHKALSWITLDISSSWVSLKQSLNCAELCPWRFK